MNLEGLTEKRGKKGTAYYENVRGEIIAKVCTKCGEVKELESFARATQKLCGVNSRCKGCDQKYRKENRDKILRQKRKYYEVNKEKVLEKGREHYEVNRENYLENSRKYYKENREKILENVRKYQKENKEKITDRKRRYCKENEETIRERMKKYYKENRTDILEQKRKYYTDNKELISEKGRKYREINREVAAERSRKWRQENPERARESVRIWLRNNPDKSTYYSIKRKARKRALPDTLTAEEYTQTLANFGNACALTGEINELHREHAIPLAIGHGGTIRENMYPMAGRLNLSKGDRNIFEWFEANRKRFKLSQERFDRLIEWLGKANDMTVEEYRDYVYWCHENPVDIDEDMAI